MMQVKHLTITHKKDLTVLVDDLSFVLGPGDRAALIGEEGNGKSTVLKLLYDPALVEGYADWTGEVIDHGCRKGYLAQELPPEALELPVLDYCRSTPAFEDTDPRELSRTARQLGLEIPDEYVLESEYRDTEGAAKATQKLLDLKKRPTCILYPDDFAALGGVSRIRENGLLIPEDISVAGYDGIRLARHASPKMTTLYQDTGRIGQYAAEKLIDLIENPRTALRDITVVEGRVLEGQTVRNLTDQA